MRKVFSFIEQTIHKELVFRGLMHIPEKQYSIGCFKTHSIYSCAEINRYIYDSILNKEPFMLGRFGGHELAMMKTVEFDIKDKLDICLDKMCNNAGFFPHSEEMAVPYLEEMKEFCRECDILGVWYQPFEGYFIQKYMQNDIILTKLFDLEPWKNLSMPWSAALKGKKVLVIHPFEETIQKQYKNREYLFPGTEVLPEFELKTLKAVQTAGGEKDERFTNWFQALDYMTEQVRLIDFDIAIIGCGAYGAPLAARIKKMGKQAIHLGGATQLMFGIYGNRWIEDNSGAFDYVKNLINSYWVRPSGKEAIKSKNKIEKGCYW